MTALLLAGGWLRAADFNVVATFPSYTINGQQNPTLTLQRGSSYTFDINAPGHPFYLKSIQGSGTGNAYTNGVSGNGTQIGTLTFAVPTNAPDTLFYNCSIHSSMTGTINIVNPPALPPISIVGLELDSNLTLRSTGTNTLTLFPEFTTNLATPSWSAITVQTNRFLDGTNETVCDRPPGTNVFIRLRAQ